MTAGITVIYLQDKLSGKNFLVDTGAAKCVFPHRSNQKPSGPRLIAADGKVIPAWLERVIPLKFGE